MKICPACSREYGDEQQTCADDQAALVHLEQSGAERAQDLIGKVVDGRYRIERIVGRGGMGTVYACRHVVVGKAFAMKVLRAGIERSEEVLQRFIREAQAANAIPSRHICQMSDFGQLPSGAFFVVMDLLEGMSLTRGLREQRLGRRDIKHVFIQIADTLEKAHKAGIIHRDLKPDNVVLVSDEGDAFFVKLVDFGIAKMMQHKASSLTETGVILGTPYYMSPEQARGDELDHRSDIYALGVMMYRAFTGRLPFVADTAMGVLTRHLTEKPQLPSRICELDSLTEALIMRCLEKRAIDRFQSMADVAEALRRVADDAPAALAQGAQSHPTLDERVTRRGSGEAQPVSEPTPTRVDTPKAKSGIPKAMPFPPEAAPGAATPWPESQRPPTGPQSAHSSAQRAWAYSAPPMVTPGGPITDGHLATPPSSGVPSGAIPLGTPPTGAHPYAPAGPLGPLATPPGLVAGGSLPPPLHGPYDPLQGEAGTARGVVSTRLEVHRAGPRKLMVVVAVVSALLIFGTAAGIALVRPGGGQATGASAEPSVPVVPTLVEPDDTAPIGEDADPNPGGSASAAPSASATTRSSAKPVSPPPPSEVPFNNPDIRDPFQNP